MSAFYIAGAVVFSLLAYAFWEGAITPDTPPKPRYSSAELGCFLLAIPMTFAAIFCFARLFGAHP